VVTTGGYVRLDAVELPTLMWRGVVLAILED
jgi:hypothetical protein